MESKKVKITNSDKQRSKDFAKASVASSKDYYATRSQTDVSKIEEDIAIGKAVEFAVCRYYQSLGHNVEEPDCKVYKGYGKSYDADLLLNANNGKQYNLHIKSCRENSNFPVSWLFQKNDSLVTRPADNDRVCLCTINLNTSTVTIIKPIQANKLTSVYGEPKLERLRHSKKTLYWKDLIEKKIIQ